MADSKRRKIAFVSSYPPRHCGIASFCRDLITNTRLADGADFEPLVVAMTCGQEQRYAEPVMFEIRKSAAADYGRAADYINFSHVDLVSIQHEYGLFGSDAGSYLLLLMERLNAPVITTLHTVLEKPEKDYLQATRRLCELSATVVVMNRRGIDILREDHGVDPKKVHLIPHGIPDLPFVDSSYYKHKFGLEGRRIILTFGLLSRNKAIETVIRAMPAIVGADPQVLYIILGVTHPEVLRQDGQEYRFELQRLVEELDLHSHVMFYNQYVTDEKLGHFLCAADIYVTPYRNRQQLTSGTLAYAVGAGKAVVSTPYIAAEDLLDDQRGILVPFNDSTALAESIISILTSEQLFFQLRRKAYDFSRTMTWPQIGREYGKLFNRKMTGAIRLNCFDRRSGSISQEIPEPCLDHLLRMTDDTGLLQHASFTLANRTHGYCTDDNARAVVAMSHYYAQYQDPLAMRLLNTYLSFICHAQQPDGSFCNVMSYDRRWLKSETRHDALCRSLWAIGTVIAHPPQPEMILILKEAFDRAMVHVPELSPRSKAYAIFGMRQYLTQFPGATEIKWSLYACADFLLHLLDHADEDWMWFEDVICYDNAALPHALFAAYLASQHRPYLDAAVKTCGFLLKHTYKEDHFSFIGCNGWFCKGEAAARFDQQPLDAMETVRMLQTAAAATSDPTYQTLQKKAFDWFMGHNDLSVPLYDFRTGGCYDGLMSNGVNLNQGAESTLSFLLALLSILESRTVHQPAVKRQPVKLAFEPEPRPSEPIRP
ncbi:MAG: glycosyltransferase family 4 protein [Planctomycetaceae bacterium]|nr:glycosyltransferase family 4 protein [Planctomycetaceae bacterium]